ncbi:hypothetical protein O983_25730 [Mycobacterium avium 09-5983]|nr:hypothetical protein O983_25730 [Mycobacterium avium 09-5983]
MCSDIDQIRMIETYDPSRHPVAEFMLTLGFGKLPDELSIDSDDFHYWAKRLFPAPIDKLARRLGVALDDISLGNVELAFATTDLTLGSGLLRKGSISGLNYEYVGYCDAHPFITHRWIHFVERDGVPEHWLKAPVPAPGEALPYQVRIEIDGRPNVAVDLLMTDPEDTVWLPTASVCIRAIPEVCAAPAGLLEEPVFSPWRPHVGVQALIGSRGQINGERESFIGGWHRSGPA